MIKVSSVFLRNEMKDRLSNKFCFAKFQKEKAECGFQCHLLAWESLEHSLLSDNLRCHPCPQSQPNPSAQLHTQVGGDNPLPLQWSCGFQRLLYVLPSICLELVQERNCIPDGRFVNFLEKNLAHQWVPLQLE